MKTFLLAAAAALVVASGASAASAASESDRSLGAGSYIHPTGPVNGIWETSGIVHHNKK